MGMNNKSGTADDIVSILCVDDFEGWRDCLNTYFVNKHVDIDLAEGYSSALEKIRNKNYALIVLDGLNGDCFKINEDIGALSHGPVILFSDSISISLVAEKKKIPYYSKSRGLDALDAIFENYLKK